MSLCPPPLRDSFTSAAGHPWTASCRQHRPRRRIHSFFWLCCYGYVATLLDDISSQQRKSNHLEDLLDASLLSMMTGTTSREVALALYVLSLSPITHLDGRRHRNRPSAVWLMDGARTVAMSSGLANTARRSIGEGANLGQPWAEEQMDAVQLVSGHYVDRPP